MWHGWAVSAWSGLVGLHEARQGGLGPFGSVKLRCVVGIGVAWLGGFGMVRSGRVT